MIFEKNHTLNCLLIIIDLNGYIFHIIKQLLVNTLVISYLLRDFALKDILWSFWSIPLRHPRFCYRSVVRPRVPAALWTARRTNSWEFFGWWPNNACHICNTEACSLRRSILVVQETLTFATFGSWVNKKFTTMWTVNRIVLKLWFLSGFLPWPMYNSERT